MTLLGRHLRSEQSMHENITYSRVYVLEKAMAPHSSTLAWENPMDGGDR